MSTKQQIEKNSQMSATTKKMLNTTTATPRKTKLQDPMTPSWQKKFKEEAATPSRVKVNGLASNLVKGGQKTPPRQSLMPRTASAHHSSSSDEEESSSDSEPEESAPRIVEKRDGKSTTYVALTNIEDEPTQPVETDADMFDNDNDNDDDGDNMSQSLLATASSPPKTAAKTDQLPSGSGVSLVVAKKSVAQSAAKDSSSSEDEVRLVVAEETPPYSVC